MNILEYENYQEQKEHGSPSFPYTTYLCTIPLDFTFVPVHWHDEMEIIYVKKGNGRITVDFENYGISAGSLAFILPGQLHSIQQYHNQTMEYENIIFHPNILMARQEDSCTSEFLLPLFTNRLTVPTLVTPSSPDYQEIASCVDGADELCKSCPRAYQFALKGQLFRLFFLLFSNCSDPVRVQSKGHSLEKIKQIVKYLENNYMNKITIAEISETAGLSQSYFMKYFKNTMGTSFIDYLNEYRLTMAARLLFTSDACIIDIASEVGFDNLSYFNRLFKKRFGMAPSQYRKSR